LRPQICPVLDSIIQDGIGKYSFNPKGYKDFSDDCLKIARFLQQGCIINLYEKRSWKMVCGRCRNGDL